MHHPLPAAVAVVAHSAIPRKKPQAACDPFHAADSLVSIL
jgi:hypothetical protein